MARMNHGFVAALVLAGCGGGSANFAGERVYDRFPLDDDLVRAWSFESDDATVPYRLAAVQLRDPESIDDGRTLIHTIEFRARCFNTTGFCVDGDDEDDEADRDDEVVMTWRMSSDSLDGIRFHSITRGTTETVFDPPLVMADPIMLVKDSVETTTDGTSYTSTYEGLVECPAPKYWTTDPPKCAEFTLDAGEATTPASGTMYVTVTVGLVAFDLDAEGSLWSLKGFTSEDL